MDKNNPQLLTTKLINYQWMWFNHKQQKWQIFPKVTSELIENAYKQPFYIGKSPIEEEGKVFPWIIYFCDAVQVATHINNSAMDNREGWANAEKIYPQQYVFKNMNRCLYRKTDNNEIIWKYFKQGRLYGIEASAIEKLEKAYQHYTKNFDYSAVTYTIRPDDNKEKELNYKVYLCEGMMQMNYEYKPESDWKRVPVRRYTTLIPSI